MTINFLSDMKYNSQVYSRHGGGFKNIGYKEKLEKIKKFLLKLMAVSNAIKILQ